MSKPSTPQQPDPVQVAQAQQATNVGTAVAQANLNNVNQVGPGGSTTYAPTGGYTDPQTGQWVPQFTATTTLSPLGNALLQGQSDVTNTLMPLIQQEAGNVQAFNPNASTDASIVNAGPTSLAPSVAQAAYNEAAGFLQPTYAQQQQNLNDQLARQGISIGNQAYTNAQTQLANTQNQGLTAAANNAITTGANIANQQYGLALQGVNQNVQNQLLSQTNPIGLLSLLTSGASLGGAA